jgi:hypothetical protein
MSKYFIPLLMTLLTERSTISTCCRSSTLPWRFLSNAGDVRAGKSEISQFTVVKI